MWIIGCTFRILHPPVLSFKKRIDINLLQYSTQWFSLWDAYRYQPISHSCCGLKCRKHQYCLYFVLYRKMSEEVILLYVAFCTIKQYRDRRKPEVGTKTYSYRMIPRVFYSIQYHRQHYTLQAFAHFAALYIHNLDDKHPSRPGFEPSNYEFLATTGLKRRLCTVICRQIQHMSQ